MRCDRGCFACSLLFYKQSFGRKILKLWFGHMLPGLDGMGTIVFGFYIPAFLFRIVKDFYHPKKLTDPMNVEL